MYRRELPRIFELHDLIMPSSSPMQYFGNFEKSVSEKLSKAQAILGHRRGFAGFRCGCVDIPEERSGAIA